ncbi:uncharacterized protein LOC6564519 [Drosophila grimshawi]|uniref:GH12316 n=1 Tax=Drosophila grimshawi TaxID=7222 RepID=B4JJ73_DROGR|nr:uncharacterized protein LOC6564519 [Drosophila grimshawi]EDV99625.1 GH12316 [Drosophila grimshawi]
METIVLNEVEDANSHNTTSYIEKIVRTNVFKSICEENLQQLEDELPPWVSFNKLDMEVLNTEMLGHSIGTQTDIEGAEFAIKAYNYITCLWLVIALLLALILLPCTLVKVDTIKSHSARNNS